MTIKHIQNVVAAYYDINRSDMIGPSRAIEFVVPRMIAMYLCQRFKGMSYPTIGREFGGRDHTTAINAIKKVTKKRQTSFDFDTTIKKLCDLLTQAEEKKEQDLNKILSEKIDDFDRCLDQFKEALKPLKQAAGLIKEIGETMSKIKVKHDPKSI